MIAMLHNLSLDIIYAIWLKKIVDTHLTQAWDKPESERDEEEDETLNELWEELDEKQQQRLWGLSADLNTLRDKETVVEADWKPMTEQQLREEQNDALARRDWDRLLESLRRPPRFRPQAQVDYMRGKAWMEMGHPEVALLFFDNAARLSSNDSVSLASRLQSLECLLCLKNWNEAVQRAQKYLKDEQCEPMLLSEIATVFIFYADATGTAEYYQRAIDVIDHFLARLERSTEHDVDQSTVVTALASKAQCLFRLGEFEKALDTYNQAIEKFPNDPLNGTLLTARGLLRLQLGSPGAMEDFKEAVGRGVPFASPYFETARAALEQGQWQETIQLCQLGLQRTRLRENQAQLFNLMAIAFYSLGDTESAGKAFERASQLDPLDDDIHANLTMFQRQIGSQRDESVSWEINASTLESDRAELLQPAQTVM